MLMDALDQVSSSERQPSLHQAVCDFLQKHKRHCCVSHLNHHFHVHSAQWDHTNLKVMQKRQSNLGWDQAAVQLRASGTGWWWGFCRCGSVWGRVRWSSTGCCTERSPSHSPPGRGSRSPCIRLSLPGGGPRCSGQPEEWPRQESGFRR